MSHFELIELDPQPAAAMRGNVAQADLPEFFGRAYHRVMEAVNAAGVSVVGPPFGFFPRMPTETVAVAAGFPVSSAIEETDDVHNLELPGGTAIVTVHIGPFETLGETYDQLMEWARTNELDLAEDMWEQYLSGPVVEPDASKWQTRIVWPVVAAEGPSSPTAAGSRS
jgi:effector-binding domain-containing protein